MTLGRLVEHDQRSRGYPAPQGQPHAVLWGHHGPVLDQFYLNACTVFALVNCLNTSHFASVRKSRHYLTHNDALTLYSFATDVDEFKGAYPPKDTGSSALGVCKAAQRIGYLTGYRWAFGFRQFAAALTLSPMIVGTNWYDSMNEPDANGVVRVEGDPSDGHEYCAIGINRRYVTCLNSWGESWGDHGRFRIYIPDFVRLLADNGDAVMPVGTRWHVSDT